MTFQFIPFHDCWVLRMNTRDGERDFMTFETKQGWTQTHINQLEELMPELIKNRGRIWEVVSR